MNHAIITGDLVKSTLLDQNERIGLINKLKNLSIIDSNIKLSIEIFRGDGIQAEVNNIEDSLRYAILLRAFLKGKKNFLLNKKNDFDIRIAIGIGKKNLSLINLPLAEQDGEAFQNSGRLLDEMKKKQSLIAIKTPNEKINEELEINMYLLEEIISKWKPLQADVIFYKLLKYTEVNVADKLFISQSAVNQTSKAAGWSAIDKLITYYEDKIKKL